MSEPLRYTLLSDGSSDRMLLPVLDWLLRVHAVAPFVSQWADLSQFRNPPIRTRDRIQLALDLFPCDLLFIHRDAEREPVSVRMAEIARHAAVAHPPWVPVVPVRMTEAWFLFDETAMRHAAGNPRGGARLCLPCLTQAEELPDPKRVLDDLLRSASGHTGRRGRQLRLGPMKHRLADLIEDFAPLRALPAFADLEATLCRVLAERHWKR